MLMRLSSLLRGLMVALLLLFAEQIAVSRGASAATGLVYLCSGGMMVIVPVDAEGNPTDALPHICPDALQGFGGLPEPDLRVEAPLSVFDEAGAPQRGADLWPVSAPDVRLARGPPKFF